MSIKSSSLITASSTLDDTNAVERQDRARQTADRGAGQTTRTRVTGWSPLRGSSPITRVASPSASQSTYTIRWPSTSIIVLPAIAELFDDALELCREAGLVSVG